MTKLILPEILALRNIRRGTLAGPVRSLAARRALNTLLSCGYVTFTEETTPAYRLTALGTKTILQLKRDPEYSRYFEQD